MFKRILIICLLLLSSTFCSAADVSFDVESSWTIPIPVNPVLETDSNDYIRSLLIPGTGGYVDATYPHRLGVSYRDYAVPVWEATVNTPSIEVIIDARNFVYLNSVNNRNEAATTGGSPFSLMSSTGDYLYVGTDKIDLVSGLIFKLATLADAGEYAFTADFTNSSSTDSTPVWSSFTIIDNTTGFSNSACTTRCEILFAKPAGWRKTTVNSIGGRYWIRIKTTLASPSPVPTAYFIAFKDQDGEAIIRGWNIVPVPVGAKGAGQDARQCPYIEGTPSKYGTEFDGILTVLSYDGKWEWDFYQFYSCPNFENGAFHANTVRKRARTLAAAAEESHVGDGSGVLPIIDLGGGAYTQYDNLGSVNLCAPSAATKRMMTKDEYLIATADPENVLSVPHAMVLELPYIGGSSQYTALYPCMRDTYRTIVDPPTVAPNLPVKWLRLGQRIQLDPTYDCKANIPNTQFGYLLSRAICKTFQTYGLILFDILGGAAKTTELESNYGKTPDIWAGLIPNLTSITLPQNVWDTTVAVPNQLRGNPLYIRAVKPVCSDIRVCPDNYVASSLPNAPTNLSASDTPADSGGSITLTWTPSGSTGVTSQRLYRGTVSGTHGTLVTTINDNTTVTYADTGRTDGVTYYYVIRSYKSPDESIDSNESNAASQDNTLAPVAPVSPTLLTIQNGSTGGGSLILSWTPSVTGTVTGQRIYRKTSSSAYSLFQTIINNTTATITDNTATTGIPFTYMIRAYNSAGESLDSDTATLASYITDIPTGIRVQVPRPIATRSQVPRGQVPRTLVSP